MTELIFIRHGETDSNAQGLLHGRTDIPLTPSGRKQAVRVAHRIQQMGNVNSIYTSPLQRAWATANEIGKRIGIEPVRDPRLVEFDFGDLEGFPFDDLQAHYPDLYFNMVDPSGFDVPFPNGESRKALHNRVTQAIDRVIEQNHTGRTIIVAHLVVIGAAVAHLTTGDPLDVAQYLVSNCSVTHLELNGSGPADIHSLNDTSHLE